MKKTLVDSPFACYCHTPNSGWSDHGFSLITWAPLNFLLAKAYYHYPSDEMPQADVNGVTTRVMMGSAWGMTSPVKTFAHTVYAEAVLNAGQSIVTPKAEQMAIYVASGQLLIGTQKVEPYTLVVLQDNTQTTIEAASDAQLAFIGGENPGERHIEWNFVSSHKHRIEQAKSDWREGRFPIVPGDEEESIYGH